MTDREKAIKAVEYLNWYFTQDDGTADENAVKAWEVFIDLCYDCRVAIMNFIRGKEGR